MRAFCKLIHALISSVHMSPKARIVYKQTSRAYFQAFGCHKARDSIRAINAQCSLVKGLGGKLSQRKTLFQSSVPGKHVLSKNLSFFYEKKGSSSIYYYFFLFYFREKERGEEKKQVGLRTFFF